VPAAPSPKVAGILLDHWKLSTFQKHLTAAGLSYDPPIDFSPGATLLKVHYHSVEMLQATIQAAQKECATAKPLQPLASPPRTS